MSSMTLEHVRNRLRKVGVNNLATPNEFTCHELADAIDAHLAGMGEPVGYLITWDDPTYRGNQTLSFNRCKEADGSFVPVFTAPPIDLAAVREVIAELRVYDIPATNTAADKLEAAIKGVA